MVRKRFFKRGNCSGSFAVGKRHWGSTQFEKSEWRFTAEDQGGGGGRSMDGKLLSKCQV